MPVNLFRILRDTWLVLLVPGIELIGLRLLLKFGWKLRFGFPGFTDFDFILAVPLAVFVFLYGRQLRNPEPLRFQRWNFILNLLATIAFLALNAGMAAHGLSLPWLWRGLLLLIILSGFAIWVPFKAYYARNQWRLALPCLGIAFVFPLYLNLTRRGWVDFGRFTSHHVQTIFRTFFSGWAHVEFDATDKLRMIGSDLNLAIGQGCIGGDGFFIFTLIFLSCLALGIRRHTWYQTLFAYSLGVGLMFYLNLFRIIALFFLGTALRNLWGIELGTKVFLLLAHAHLGWIFYLFGLWLFFLKWMPLVQPSKVKLNREGNLRWNESPGR